MCVAREHRGVRSRSSRRLYSSYIQLLSEAFPHIVRDHAPIPCRFFASSNGSCLSGTITKSTLRKTVSSRIISGIDEAYPQYASPILLVIYLGPIWHVEMTTASWHAELRLRLRLRMRRRKLRLRLVQPQKKLRILLSPMASTANLECSGFGQRVFTLFKVNRSKQGIV